ncbi:hypothetical protein AURDEDRAFT_111130 [Auricularia subglabra TFB-10046 SS5]|nr:hypothetical protein AURDEDRAFT_111130 [Auricularia subglabra TFB-10046 SS5]
MSSTSRSSSPFHSSPATPESSQSAEFMGDPVVQGAGQMPLWDGAGAQSLSELVNWPWASKDAFAHQQPDILSLDDLITEDAFEPMPDAHDDAQDQKPVIQYHPAHPLPAACSPAELHALHSPAPAELAASNGNPNAAPATQQREDSPSTGAVCPPKEACQDLLIVFPNLPPHGTKSRVETQIRTELTLSTIPNTYPPAHVQSWDRVASWKWIRLPKGTSTKKRSRKDAKIAPVQEDILDVSVDVVGVSAPDVQVTCCESCQQREAKRTARKIAARVRPTKAEPAETDIGEGEAKIVHFNCPELVDFSTGMAALPLRITCYCRHHREKIGFSVIFTLRDIDGRVIGSGSTPPIMITDDHKSQSMARSKEAVSAEEDTSFDIPGQVRGTQRPENKKRAKPYDRRVSRSSTGASGSLQPLSTNFFPTAPPSPSASPSHSFASPTDSAPIFSALSPSAVVTLGAPPPPQFPAPTGIATPQRSPSPAPAQYPPYPVLYGMPPPPVPYQPALPKIHRLIPASGPTHGGIEITVLGANFTSTSLACSFGGTRATSTQKWSDNTLVCILPPRATAGQVSVVVERLDDGALSEEHDVTAGNVFTYVDDSDRALMELALQVVGLKMTGKIEEAKNVALRIVGSAGNGTSMESEASGMTTLANDAPDPRTLLLQCGRIADMQGAIINLLSSYFPAPGTSTPANESGRRNPLSHKARTGQTLLHLATILNMSRLVSWLISRGIEVDAQDHNGFTALHFAVLAGSRECAATLFRAGADRTKRTHSGLTPAKLAGDWVSHLLRPSREASEDADAEWGSDESDDSESTSERSGSPTVVPHSPTPSTVTRRRRARVTSGSESEGDGDGEPVSPPATPGGGTDEKRGWLHRKLAHLQPPQGIMQVPWDWSGALQQIPVFYVPVPGWPWSPPATDEKREPGAEPSIRESWEKWAVQMLTSPRLAPARPPAPVPEQQTADEERAQTDAPAQEHTYPPAPAAQDAVRAQATTERSRMYARIARSLGYVPAAVGEAEINSYGALEVKARRGAKQDRMLVWFWLPILLLGLAWVLYTGVFVAYGTIYKAVRAFLPLRDVLPV